MGTKKKTGGGGGSMDATESTGASSSAYSNLSFTDVLEDLSSRFIVNLPAEEQVSIQRICFQVEQAHWFYEDFLRPLNPSLPSLALRRFSSYLLHTAALTVPLIQKYIASGSQKNDVQGLEAAFEEFMHYKTRVPVCGAVLLNAKLNKCILVKGWKASATWGFPKGKINQKEAERDCAVREVFEETGFDCSPLLPSASNDFMELTMREQKIRLYIVPGLDENTQFETQTRKEISKIAWFNLSDLPTWKKNKAPPQGMGGKFYLISPFIGKLKQWINDNRSRFAQAQQIDVGTEEAEGQDSDVGARRDRSDDLKSLLGVGASPIPVASNAAPPLSAIDGKGSRMIEAQGDERSRQLLDLLRGAPAAADITPGPPELNFGGGENGAAMSVQQIDDRDRGTASLLAALNAGAGRPPISTHAQGPSSGSQHAQAAENDSGSLALLAMLNGQSGQHFSPMHAPQAQSTNQAQNLLNLISHSTSGRSIAASATGPNGASIPLQDDKEAERTLKRDKLLDSLLSSSLSLADQPAKPHSEYDARNAAFPPAPFPAHPPQPTLAPRSGDWAHGNATFAIPLPPSPFSAFVQRQADEQKSHPAPAPQRSLNEQTNGGNPLLALLNQGPGAAASPTQAQAPWSQTQATQGPPHTNHFSSPIPPPAHQPYGQAHAPPFMTQQPPPSGLPVHFAQSPQPTLPPGVSYAFPPPPPPGQQQQQPFTHVQTPYGTYAPPPPAVHGHALPFSPPPPPPSFAVQTAHDYRNAQQVQH